MLYLEDFFDEGIKNIESSFKEENLNLDPKLLRSIAICWSLNTEEGPAYYRITTNEHAGRNLLELFAKLADTEEEEIANESKS